MSTHTSSLTSFAYFLLLILVSCHLIRVCTSQILTYDEEANYKGEFCKSDTAFLEMMCIHLAKRFGLDYMHLSISRKFKDVTCEKGRLFLPKTPDGKDMRETGDRDFLLVCDCFADRRRALGRGEKDGDVVLYYLFKSGGKRWQFEQKIPSFLQS